MFVRYTNASGKHLTNIEYHTSDSLIFISFIYFMLQIVAFFVVANSTISLFSVFRKVRAEKKKENKPL